MASESASRDTSSGLADRDCTRLAFTRQPTNADMSGNQNRAKLLPGSKNGQPIIMWDGEPLHFPVHDELVLHATEGGTPPPPQARVIDASGRVLCTYEASLSR